MDPLQAQTQAFCDSNHFQLHWQYVKADSPGSGVRLLKVYSDQNLLFLPSRIEEMEIREIGPYCFSPSGGRGRTGGTDGFFSSVTVDGAGRLQEIRRIDRPSLPPQEGSYLEKVFLPLFVQVIHNAAFYNCRRLAVLGTGPKITSIGSDVFTNCSRLSQLVRFGDPAKDGGLSLILARFEQELEILFYEISSERVFADPSRPDSQKKTLAGALFFPEYYEWLDEVTPAHLFSRSIHGEGFRMRRCFRNGSIDFEKYDRCFSYALKTDTPAALCRIALDRLRWPLALKETAKELYKDTLKKHFDTAFSLAADQRDLDLLSFLFTEIPLEASELRSYISQSAGLDWGEGAAFLMDLHSRLGSFARKSYSFDHWL